MIRAGACGKNSFWHLAMMLLFYLLPIQVLLELHHAFDRAEVVDTVISFVCRHCLIGVEATPANGISSIDAWH